MSLRHTAGGRRRALQALLALGCFGALPMRRPSAASVLDIVAWKGQFPPEELRKFTEATSIDVHLLEVSSDNDFLRLMRATSGREFDLIFPSNSYAAEWDKLGLLKPFHASELPIDDLHPTLMEAAKRDWNFSTGLLWVPFLWTGELLCWHDKGPEDDGSGIGYGSLWKYKQRGVGHASSLIMAAALHMEDSGELEKGALLRSHEDIFRMRSVWDQVLEWCVRRKDALGKVCAGNDSSVNCVPSGNQTGIMPDSVIRSLNRQGAGLKFAAAAEGAMVSVNGAAMPLGARNTDEAHEFVRHFLKPEIAARCFASHGLYPSPTGVAELMSEADRNIYEQTYGENAMKTAFVLPSQPAWFRRRKTAYERILTEPEPEPT